MAKKLQEKKAEQRTERLPALFLWALAAIFAAQLAFLLVREVREYRPPVEKWRWPRTGIGGNCMAISGDTAYFIDASRASLELRDRKTGAVKGSVSGKRAIWAAAAPGNKVAVLCAEPFRVAYFEGAAEKGGFMLPGLSNCRRIAAGQDGTIYVSVQGRDEIHAFAAEGRALFTVELDRRGRMDGWSGAIAVSDKGRLVTVDNKREVREYDAATGVIINAWQANRLDPRVMGMVQIACAADGLYYFLDYNGHGVKVYRPGGAYMGRFSGGRGKANELFYPGSIASDSEGIYVCTVNLYAFDFFGGKI